MQRAYVVLSGGGIKGAALAGCVAATTSRKIEIAGFGGTSAGAIVGLLGASGCLTKNELYRITVQCLDVNQLLDDGGAELNAVKASVQEVQQARSSLNIGKLLRKLAIAKDLQKKASQLGLYSGEVLREFLFDKVRENLSELNNRDFSFLDFHRAGGKPLQIVATDLRSRKAKIFSLKDTPTFPVLDAVRASAAYPFVYKPIVGAPNEYLIDGGLASNLPVFLFNEERLKDRLPMFAYDLVVDRSLANRTNEYDLGRFARDMLSTALEAGDALMRTHLSGVSHVPIQIPDGIDALDFNISEQERANLFNAGFAGASAFFDEYPPAIHAKEAQGNIKRLLQSRYGPAHLYDPVLAAIAPEIEEISNAEDVRVSIMLPSVRTVHTRIVVYDYKMGGDLDADLELGEFSGCSGQALAHPQGIAVADLAEVRFHPEASHMTKAQITAVPSDRKSILSVVIPGWDDPKDIETDQTQMDLLPRIGVLSIDSVTVLQDTGWIDRQNKVLENIALAAALVGTYSR